MAHLNFDEVKVVEDTMTDVDVIRTIIKEEHEEGPFYIFNVADVVQKHLNWIAKMPKVVPHYAVKCNSDPMVIKILAAMNVGFDCASEQEITQVMRYDVPAERIIFANPAKCPSHIKFAKKMNVKKMTVDCEVELLKISDLFPDAEIVIRFRCDANDIDMRLRTKFGCDPDEEADRLIKLTKNLGLTLIGFSFHGGSPCRELIVYSRGIAICKRLIANAREIGCENVRLIDIGGGFIGVSQSGIDDVASVVNDAIQDIDPSITIISEPGQYYVASAFTLASYLHTKKVIPREGEMIRMYYMNCGVYNGFIEELYRFKSRIPIPLYMPANKEKFLSSVWGPTADSLDIVLKNVLLPELKVGDWLIWKDMGAYSLPLSFKFNGFSTPTVYYYARRSQWHSAAAFMKSVQQRRNSITGIETS